MIQPNEDGTIPSDSDDANEYEALAGYQYTVAVGGIGIDGRLYGREELVRYAGPDVVGAEKHYAQSVAAVVANPNRPAPMRVTLAKRWEGKHAASDPEVVKEQMGAVRTFLAKTKIVGFCVH